MATWEDVIAIASKLPWVEESTLDRSAPSLKVAGRSFARLRTEAEGALVLMCGLSEKEALLATGDPAFFTTAHTTTTPPCSFIWISLTRNSSPSSWSRPGGSRRLFACGGSATSGT